MADWYLYMIRTSNNCLYTGITPDVKRRFSEHESGSPKGSKFLKGKAPLKLVFKSKIGDRSLATKIELAVKSLPKEKKEMIVSKKLKISEILL